AVAFRAEHFAAVAIGGGAGEGGIGARSSGRGAPGVRGPHVLSMRGILPGKSAAVRGRGGSRFTTARSALRSPSPPASSCSGPEPSTILQWLQRRIRRRDEIKDWNGKAVYSDAPPLWTL